jgi:hypothetical protein
MRGLNPGSSDFRETQWLGFPSTRLIDLFEQGWDAMVAMHA